MTQVKTNKKERFDHYGLEFVMANGHLEIEEMIAKLAKQNRRAREMRSAKTKTVKELQDDLRNGGGKATENELNRRFAKLRSMREKS